MKTLVRARNGRAPAVGFGQRQGNITPFRAGAAAAPIWPVITSDAG